MKKYLLGSVAALLLSVGSASAEGTYFSILGGSTYDPRLMAGGTLHDMSAGYNGGVRLGTGIGSLPGFSIEGDAFYNRSGFKGTGGHLASTSLMGDLIYHANLGLPLSLYGGAGLGMVETRVGGALPHGSSIVMGWQALGGLEFPVSDSMTLFTEYRYQNAHAANTGALAHVGNTSNNLSLGVKFNL